MLKLRECCGVRKMQCGLRFAVWCFDAVCTSVMRCGLHFVDACRDWPRRATPFLCFAKERKQRKATAARCPFGVPEPIRHEAGSAKTRLRLKHLRFCFRFPPDWFGSSQRNCPKPNPKTKKQKQNRQCDRHRQCCSHDPAKNGLRIGVAVKTPWDAAEKRQCKADQK